MTEKKTRQTLISKVTDQHDEEAWAEFVSYYQDYLLRVLRRYKLTEEEIHDSVQNSLVKIWKELPDFTYDPSKGKFRSWIAQIAINDMRTIVRKEVKTREAIANNRDILAHDNDLSNELEQEWKIFVAQRAWENINPYISDAMKECFDLHLQGQSSVQISEKLKISESTARVYKKRVGYKLKYEIARLEKELN